jgi:ABC-type transport system involved in multi-copper enzyme maturation permease subunit
MSVRDLKGRHIRLVCAYAARHAVRGGTGIVFAVATLFFGLITAHLILEPVEMQVELVEMHGGEMSRADAVKELVKFARKPVEWAIGGQSLESMVEGGDSDASRWASHLLDARPALLSAIFLILLVALPFLVALGAFNQLSGDVQTRGIRYQLLRVARTNLFLGRFLAVVAFTAGLLAVVVATVALYIGLDLKVYDAGALAGWSLWGFAALTIASIPYIALCSWISASVDSPFGSLTIANIVIGAVPLFALIGRASWKPLAYVNYLLPWGTQTYLLHPDASKVLLAVASCAGYTLLFLFLGHMRFVRRDL